MAAHRESILKADSLSRMLAARSTKWLPPREACCMEELYLPRAAQSTVHFQNQSKQGIEALRCALFCNEAWVGRK